METPQIFFETINHQVPLLSVVMVTILIFSMDEKYWFMTLALIPCLVALYFLYNPTMIPPSMDYRKQDLLMKDIVLTLVLVVLCLSVFLDADHTKTYQTILAGVSFLLMCIIASLICYTTRFKNYYINTICTLTLVAFYSFFFVWAALDNKTVDKILFRSTPIFFLFFTLVYIVGASRFLFEKKKQSSSLSFRRPASTYAFGPFQLKSLQQTKTAY